MGYYFFNRQELLQNAKDLCGGKEKAAENDIENKDLLKENAKNKYKNLPEEKKEVKGENGRNRYRNMTKNKKIG